MATPKFYDVPAGTRSSQCNGPNCKAVIYFVASPTTGRPMPIDCDVEGGEAPSAPKDPRQLDAFGASLEAHAGRGVLHFLTCPDAAQFTGRGKS